MQKSQRKTQVQFIVPAHDLSLHQELAHLADVNNIEPIFIYKANVAYEYEPPGRYGKDERDGPVSRLFRNLSDVVYSVKDGKELESISQSRCISPIAIFENNAAIRVVSCVSFYSNLAPMFDHWLNDTYTRPTILYHAVYEKLQAQQKVIFGSSKLQKVFKTTNTPQGIFELLKRTY